MNDPVAQLLVFLAGNFLFALVWFALMDAWTATRFWFRDRCYNRAQTRSKP